MYKGQVKMKRAVVWLVVPFLTAAIVSAICSVMRVWRFTDQLLFGSSAMNAMRWCQLEAVVAALPLSWMLRGVDF